MQIARADISEEISGGGVDLAALITLMHARHPIDTAAAGVAGAPVAATSPDTVSTATAIGKPESATEATNHDATGVVAQDEAARIKEGSHLATARGASGSLSTANATTSERIQLQQPVHNALDHKGEVIRRAAVQVRGDQTHRSNAHTASIMVRHYLSAQYVQYCPAAVFLLFSLRCMKYCN